MENLFFNGMLSNMLITLLIIIVSVFGVAKFVAWINSDDDSKKAVTKRNDYDD